jgi:hypothetical protein
MAPSNLFKQFCPSIGGSFSPRTVKWRLFYHFGPFKGTSRDALTLHVLYIRPSSVEGLKCLERSRYGSPRRRPIAKFFFGWGVEEVLDGRIASPDNRHRIPHSAIYCFCDQLAASIIHILLICVLARQV